MRAEKYFWLQIVDTIVLKENRVEGKWCKAMHTIGLNTGCHIDCGLINLKRRVKMYERPRVDMVSNQADKQIILEVMKS